MKSVQAVRSLDSFQSSIAALTNEQQHLQCCAQKHTCGTVHQPLSPETHTHSLSTPTPLPVPWRITCLSPSVEKAQLMISLWPCLLPCFQPCASPCIADTLLSPQQEKTVNYLNHPPSKQPPPSLYWQATQASLSAWLHCRRWEVFKNQWILLRGEETVCPCACVCVCQGVEGSGKGTWIWYLCSSTASLSVSNTHSLTIETQKSFSFPASLHPDWGQFMPPAGLATGQQPSKTVCLSVGRCLCPINQSIRY